MSNVLGRREVILRLLGGLKHKLKGTALMGPVERLNYTVVRETTTKPRKEAGVESIHKPLADADWVCSLAREGASSTHELLEVRLHCAHDLISCGIRVNLTNVFQRSVRLRTVSRAQLREECVTDCWCHYAKDLLVDLHP